MIVSNRVREDLEIAIGVSGGAAIRFTEMLNFVKTLLDGAHLLLVCPEPTCREQFRLADLFKGFATCPVHDNATTGELCCGSNDYSEIIATNPDSFFNKAGVKEDSESKS